MRLHSTPSAIPADLLLNPHPLSYTHPSETLENTGNSLRHPSCPRTLHTAGCIENSSGTITGSKNEKEMNVNPDGYLRLAMMITAMAGCSDSTTSTEPVDLVTEPGINAEYTIVDTGQEDSYDAYGNVISPSTGEAFFGQDGQFDGTRFSFRDNGDGTISDLNTGLMWQKVPSSSGFTWEEAMDYCDSLELAGYDDWRSPSLKELFSLSDFSKGWPYLDTSYFELASGWITKDEQYWSSNSYQVGTTHDGAASAFGVNHVTGHIKTYPSSDPGPVGRKFVRAVRGDYYGTNSFMDNANGTITDESTGLVWMQSDLGVAVDWEHALLLADTLSFAGYDDWRLPNVRELQSIVDYSGVFPAIDSLFTCTLITNEAGEADYGYYWSSTSAYFGPDSPEYYYAWYVAFGRAVDPEGHDIHGAGAVRFDTKKQGGPAGEGGERIFNFVRLVRDAT